MASMPTLLAYRNDLENPFCEIAFDNGERITVRLAADGITIDRLAGDGRSVEALFRATPEIAARICAALIHPAPAGQTTPLDILLAAVTALGSPGKVARAFRDAAGQAGD